MCRSAPPSAAGPSSLHSSTHSTTHSRTAARTSNPSTQASPPQRGDMGPGVGGVHGRLLRSPRGRAPRTHRPRSARPHRGRPVYGAVELKRLEIERSDLWGRMAPILSDARRPALPDDGDRSRPAGLAERAPMGFVDEAGYHSPEMTTPFNLLAPLPALSVPCGHDSAGMPIGAQIVGRRWRDDTVLVIGRALELAPPVPRRVRRPDGSWQLGSVARQSGLGRHASRSTRAAGGAAPRLSTSRTVSERPLSM